MLMGISDDVGGFVRITAKYEGNSAPAIHLEIQGVLVET